MNGHAAIHAVAEQPVENRDCELPLGAPVLIAGTVIGRTEFQGGPPTYLVEFARKGRSFRDWFVSEELDTEL